MDILLAVGLGVGLASLAGLRAFLLPALSALLAALGLFDLDPSAPGVAANEWVLFGGLTGLAVLEIVLDKVRSVERVFNWVMVPVRGASGALLFGLVAAGFAGAVPGLVAGGVLAGTVAALKVLLRPPAQGTSSGVSASFLSLAEDAVALVGGLIGFFVPFLPVLLVGFLLFFYARIRRRRGRKFGGLRILGD